MLNKSLSMLLCKVLTSNHPLWWFFIAQIWGKGMEYNRRIEKLRKKCGASILEICNIMGCTEEEYRRIIMGKLQPTIYQLCMIVAETKHPL